jgi:hypothetical protein
MNSPCFGHSPWGPPAAARSELVRSGVSEGAMSLGCRGQHEAPGDGGRRFTRIKKKALLIWVNNGWIMGE